jgi:RecB family exonuclease
MFERDPLYPTLDEIINFYSKKWSESIEKIEFPNEDQKEEQSELFFEEGIKILKNFYKKNSPWNFNTVELESRFSIDVEDDSTGSMHTLTGFIDRIDKETDKDEYEIIDYKTGKKMPSQEMLEDNMQLALYSLALKTRWPNLKPENIKTSLYFLKHNEKISSTNSLDKLELAKKNILTIIQEIERRIEDNDFPPTTGPLCGWCGFKKICPMWSHEYKKDDEPNVDEKQLQLAIDKFLEIKRNEEENKKRISELRSTILSYMDKESVNRVFGNSGYITKNEQERYTFDMDKIKPILEELNRWDDVLIPDAKKLETIIPSLPSDEQEKIINYRNKKSFVVLKQTKK